MEIRRAEEPDHPRIVRAVSTWWSDSRSPESALRLASLLPRLFLQHFASTSFVVDDQDGLAAFLVGFFSADHSDVAYIHFVGVAPRCRGTGVARDLYERFFDVAMRAGRTRVKSITSPGNAGSIAFHWKMGFELVPGDSEQDGVPVHTDYDGQGNPRVCFHRHLTA